MAKIKHLHIQNFRGIKDLICDFSDSNMCCLIGHCDSGKSTILTAIANLFSTSWTIPVCDEDFHNMDITQPIVISGIVSDIPTELMSFEKFGLHTFEESDEENALTLLEIVLTVESDLEPRWEVHNRNCDEYYPISNKERALFNIRMIDDYFDTQFNMSKYSLLKELVNDVVGKDAVQNNIGIELIRDIKSQLNVGGKIDEAVSSAINTPIAELGGESRQFSLAVPTSELLLRGNQISLQADNIPVKLLGKGSRRQISLALQMALSNTDSPVILIDEIEQGLEPYKVKTIVRTLKDAGAQVIVTSHSSMVLFELNAEDLFLLKKGASHLFHLNSSYQQLLRTNPDAFFFDKLIVCEGKTEYGFTLELDRYLWKTTRATVSSYTVAPILGDGSTIVPYCRLLSSCGKECLCFMDNDVKKTLTDVCQYYQVCCSESGNAIEEQFFKDAPLSALNELMTQLKNSGKIRTAIEITEANRKEIGIMSKDKEWLKNIQGGRFMGDSLFQHFEELDKSSHLYKQVQQLQNWIAGIAQ